MAGSRDVIVADGKVLAEHKPTEDRLDAAYHRVASGYLELIEAIQHFADDDADIDKLPTSKMRRVARMARDHTKQDAPVGLLAAVQFGEAFHRKQGDRDRGHVNINVSNQTTNYVSLPPQVAPDPPELVKYVDADELRPEEDDE